MAGNLGLPARGFRTRVVVTHAYICLTRRSTAPHGAASAHRVCSPTDNCLSHGFGGRLMPAHHPRPPARPVSCYALLGRMAASKPTSRLSLQADLVITTQAALGGLGRWSGFFPSRDRTLAPCPSLPGMNTAAFGVWPGSAGGEAPSPVQYLYLRGAKPEAAPKGISGSTSYLPA